MHLVNNFIELTLVLFSLLLLTCSEAQDAKLLHEDLSVVSNSHKKLVYAEEVENAEGIINSGWANIIIYGLINNQKTTMTINDAININPSFSSDGKYIYFFSTKNIDKRTVDLLGLSSPLELLQMEIKNRETRSHPNEKLSELLNNIKANNLYQVSDSLYSFQILDTIYSFNTNKNRIKSELGINYLSHYSINQNKTYVALSCDAEKLSPEINIMIYDVNKKTKNIIANGYNISLGNWNSRGDTFCFVDSLIYFYDVIKGRKYSFDNDLFEKEGITVSDSYFVSANELVLIGCKEDIKRACHKSYDLYLFNIDKKRLVKITRDGNVKEAISVYQNIMN